MKPLEEEILIELIFNIIKKVSPITKTPPPQMVMLSHLPAMMGRGGPRYGINIDLTKSGEPTIWNDEYIDTVVHEVVHYNGVMGHGPRFTNVMSQLSEQVMKEITEERRKLNGNATAPESKEATYH